ncbi:MAG TPA: TolC family protein [Chitinophagales bacterium]|nr:TolC family protein [Chitinophagales bacterium]
MKTALRTGIIFLMASMLVCAATSVKASVSDTLPAPVDTTAELILPPLDTLYAWAELLSPTLKGQDALIEKNTADAKRVKKILLDAVKLNAGIQYGNYGNPLITQLETGYSTGATVSFSLYQLFGYKNQVQVYNAEKKVSEFKRDELDMDLRKLITILYNNILAQRNILKIRSSADFAAYSHVKMAEKEFTEGSLEIGELSRVTEIYTKAQVDYELAVNDLKNYYMQLEQLVGVPLSSYKPQ